MLSECEKDSAVARSKSRLEARFGPQVVRIEPWGPGAIRVRVGLHRIVEDLPGSLLPAKKTHAVMEEIASGGWRLSVPDLVAVLGRGGELSFQRTDGSTVLEESPGHFWSGGARRFTDTLNTYSRIEQRFAAIVGEAVFGLGQHRNGVLDHKGLTLELVQHNAEINIPFYLSSAGYGFLWNSPAVGEVDFNQQTTRWISYNARQIDYVVFVGNTPKQILSRYADATGHAPAFPAWATGFWQSKLRYRTQEELLGAAREYWRRGIPVSVMVSDFFHWTKVGELQFDPDEFPNPKAMIDELAENGTRLMVSVWPTLSPLSEQFEDELQQGHLVATERGVPYVLSDWDDKGFEQRLPVTYYDSTNPSARHALWKKAVRGYYDLGVRIWWLDACEPEIRPCDYSNVRFHSGLGSEVANSFPLEHARGFYEGMQSKGESDILLFCRSAFAGSQRYGAAIWSGDIEATFSSLKDQIRAGISMGIAGIPWWTTDTGGFHGGNPKDPSFQELMVRWFEFSVFCPILRMHGHRDPRGALDGSTDWRAALGPRGFGGENEIWSYGNEAYQAMRELIEMRERIRPYVAKVMEEASETGIPAIRALFLDFPADPVAWTVEDQFLFGPDILVSPVTTRGVDRRSVYLPAGEEWTDPWSGHLHAGGQTVEVPAPLGRPAVFLRGGAQIPVAP